MFNRYYDPATGQFLTVDPALDVTQAPYQYVDEDPTNGSDPTGLCLGGLIPGGCWSAITDTVRHPLATYNAGGGLRTSAKVFATTAAIGSVAATGGAAALGEGAFFIGDDLVTAETLDSMSTAMGWTATDADFGVLAGDAISGACSKTMEDDLLSFGGDLAAFGAGRLLAGPLEGALRDVRTFGRPLPGAFTSRLAPLFFNATMPFATWEGANG